ncbi:hypothetical protein OESDEN_22968, partial [Oesophagostomum dentatum]
NDGSSAEEDQVTTTSTTYSVAVRTSALENAETAAFVFVQLIDEAGNKTDRVKLKCSLTHRKKYQRGHVVFGQRELCTFGGKLGACSPTLIGKLKSTPNLVPIVAISAITTSVDDDRKR